MSSFRSRAVDGVVLSRWQSEGMGARVRRSIGGAQLPNVGGVFLLLDEFNAGLPAAFPDHAHRGMATVSFLLPWSEGGFQHEDSKGHKGKLEAGDLQFMVAGRGIAHSEVPMDERAAHGVQLWVNLKRKDKMMEPSYQDLKWGDIAKASKDGVDVAVISGSSLGVKSPVYTPQPVEYLFVNMAPGTTFEQPINPGWVAFAYVLKGSADFSGTAVGSHNTVTFKDQPEASGVRVEAQKEAVTFILLSGEPIDEPVVQHGPFVMNTREEIMQAFADYRYGRNGFEGAPQWESEIAKKL